jgi:conjugal transfer pilus assembly protein TraE
VNLRFQKIRTTSLHWQRNALGILSAGLLLVVILQMILLFFKDTKIIVHPPETRQEYWIEGNKFSPSYLEEQASYFAHLLLDITKDNLMYQGDILMRYVDPRAHGDFRMRMMEDQIRLKRDDLSLIFVPVTCEVFPESLAVEITGDLNGYVASKRISTHRETYRVQFSNIKGRLFLQSFKVLKTDQEGLPLPDSSPTN